MSLAKACRIRGAPIMLPKAEDSVAANTPAVINSGQRAISATTNEFAVSSGPGRLAASSTAMAK